MKPLFTPFSQASSQKVHMSQIPFPRSLYALHFCMVYPKSIYNTFSYPSLQSFHILHFSIAPRKWTYPTSHYPIQQSFLIFPFFTLFEKIMQPLSSTLLRNQMFKQHVLPLLTVSPLRHMKCYNFIATLTKSKTEMFKQNVSQLLFELENETRFGNFLNCYKTLTNQTQQNTGKY